MEKHLYKNGSVQTMTAAGRADWLLCADGRIVRAGTGPAPDAEDARVIDLGGGALLPSFLDPHSHLVSLAGSLTQLSLEGASGPEEIRERLAAFIRESRPEPGEWVVACGYDHNLLPDKRHVTAAELDAVSPRNPVLVQHKSGHCGVLNSAAMEKLDLGPSTRPLPGGRIGRENGAPNGLVEEADFVSRVRQVPAPDFAKLADAFRRAQDIYFSHGITTIQEGLMVREMLPLYRAFVSGGCIRADVVGYPEYACREAYAAAFPDSRGGYAGGLRLGGAKIILDGSPQGRTAWMRAPYAAGDGRWTGYPALTDAAVQAAAEDCEAHGVQLLAHCNGDAACAQLLAAFARIGGTKNRAVIVHAQLIGLDQLDAVKELGLIPSFFAAHVYHWGDVHAVNFGPERAARISPARSALERGIPFTFHQDTPVLPPDMLETVWCAVRRRTRSGVLLGAEERIGAAEALRAVTVNAACQYGEEKEKGALAPGLQENLALLDRDPLAADPDELPFIRVTRTILRGRELWRAPEQN